MEIGGLQKLTLIDYPSKIACTVFLIGCNFRCPWCYNPGLVLPEQMKKQPKIPEKNFFRFLKERKNILEGVCITGGEPTIHPGLPDFIKKIKKLGYAVKLDTNGSNPEIIERLINDKLIDYVAMDIKASKEKYNKTAGVRLDINKIQKSISLLKKNKIAYEFRTTVLPKIHGKKDISNIAKWLKGVGVYYLQQFQPKKTIDLAYKKIKPCSQKQLELLQKEGNKYLPTELRNY